jgi:hypothetical protein
MQREVDFWEWLLFLDGADSIVKVFGLIYVLLVALHIGDLCRGKVWVRRE